jgi:hypothetical protein
LKKIKRHRVISLTVANHPLSIWKRLIVASLTLILLLLVHGQVLAQNQTDVRETPSQEVFHLERVPVEGGAELVTIQARVDGSGTANSSPQWIPMVSVLRDTLGDAKNENDRLRYLWALTYTRPTFWQRVSGAIPFLYTRVGNKQNAPHDPPPLMDLSAADHDVWDRACWGALQTILLDSYGTPIRASTRAYRRNITDFRKSHVIRALALLSLYQQLGQERIFSDSELKEIQARLLLTDKPFGGLIDDLKLQQYYQKETTKVEDARGHNWELLRQQAEANGLYFEPLEMPDGSATHALLWIARPELGTRASERFDGRFLNIANPWTDKRLRDWHGYIETRTFDAEHRSAKPDSPGATEVEMIPLALYGLDHPRIPVLLVDFRDSRNPKRREMSRRILQDVTKNVLAISQFGDLPYLLGRSVFDFVTGRRGMDINQPSRLRTYSQLKLLLSLNASLEPELRSEISDRLESVSLNPLENGVEAERLLARQQYDALLAYAARPDGLPAKLARDRRAEMVHLEHNGPARFVFRLANVLSFGKYTHREKESPDMQARLDITRQLAYHTRFLREVSQSGVPSGAAARVWESGPRIDVTWNMDEVRRSLKFMAEHGSSADAKAVVATARIFARTEDVETRRDCLGTLSQINNSKARAELLRISQRKDLDQGWRDLSAQYLTGTVRTAEPVISSGSVITTGGPD